MRGVDFKNIFSYKINIYIKYRKVIINGILNPMITPTPANT